MKKIYLVALFFVICCTGAKASGGGDNGSDASNISASKLSSHELVNYYPNPFSDQLTVKWDASSIKNISIYNILGMKVMAVPMGDDNRDVILNTSNLGSGVYFLQVETETGQQTYRLVK